MVDFNGLSQCPLFRGITFQEGEELLKKVNYQVKRFKKDEIVAIAGEVVQHMNIILSGSVRGEMIDYSGKIIKIEDIEAPKPIASAFLFGKENCFPVTVTANDEVKILAIPVPEFLKILQFNTQILRNYLNTISTRAQFLSQKLNFLSFKTIKEKVAHFLLQQAGDKLHSVFVDSTQQQLADLFGVTRPSLARVFSEMQKENLIEIEKRTIKILNKEKLSMLLLNG